MMRPVLASVLALVVASAASAAAATQPGLLAELRLDASARYTALLHIGTPAQPKSLLFDISQNYVRLQCERGAASTPSAPFDPRLSSTFRPASGQGHGQLVADTFTFNSTNGKTAGEQDVAVKAVKFFCAPPSPRALTGVAGFGSGKLALPSMVALREKLPRRFAYCLSGSVNIPTPLFLGASNYTFIQRQPLNGLLLRTPLLKTGGGYRVAVLALKVGETTVPLKPAVFGGGLEISTTEQYTKLVRPAYAALVKAFTAAENGIPRVSARAPFEICYNATGLGSTRVGPPVNAISFVFADNSTEWILYGENTMVFVSEEVLCLGFLDAGPLPAARSVLGTFQQQDSLVELDLDRNQLAFYSTLPFIETICADFNFSRGSF